jgi:peptide/nickel transport system permease protein
MVLTLWVVVTITFFLSYLIPGDPARLIAGATASPEQVELVRHELGLDQPVAIQYGRYILRLLRGDLGESLQSRRGVSLDIRDYFGATLELSTCALLVTLAAGIPLGVLSAVHRDRAFDHANRLLSLSGVSLPVFWLALLMQLLFSQALDVLPLGGRIAAGSAALPHYTGLYSIDSLIAGDWARFKDVIIHLILPTICIAYPSLATVTRMVRANMLEVLQEDYLRTARAYGLPSRVIYFRHALKNAMLPTITVIGLVYGYTLGGSLLAEMIFFWPGLGRYAAFAIINSDYPAIMGVTLTIAVTYMALNLVIDLAYGLFDPRIRVRG